MFPNLQIVLGKLVGVITNLVDGEKAIQEDAAASLKFIEVILLFIKYNLLIFKQASNTLYENNLAFCINSEFSHTLSNQVVTTNSTNHRNAGTPSTLSDTNRSSSGYS